MRGPPSDGFARRAGSSEPSPGEIGGWIVRTSHTSPGPHSRSTLGRPPPGLLEPERGAGRARQAAITPRPATRVRRGGPTGTPKVFCVSFSVGGSKCRAAHQRGSNGLQVSQTANGEGGPPQSRSRRSGGERCRPVPSSAAVTKGHCWEAQLGPSHRPNRYFSAAQVFVLCPRGTETDYRAQARSQAPSARETRRARVFCLRAHCASS